MSLFSRTLTTLLGFVSSVFAGDRYYGLEPGGLSIADSGDSFKICTIQRGSLAEAVYVSEAYKIRKLPEFGSFFGPTLARVGEVYFCDLKHPEGGVSSDGLPSILDCLKAASNSDKKNPLVTKVSFFQECIDHSVPAPGNEKLVAAPIL